MTDTDGRAAALRWIKSAVDANGSSQVNALTQIIDDCPVVAFGEGVHGALEPLELRNALFQKLVEERSFTAIALECGLVESRLLHDYVRGARNDLDFVINNGLSWTFDRYRQNAELIKWVRDWNARTDFVQPVNIYGFDLSGSPGCGDVKRGTDTALRELRACLDEIDPSIPLIDDLEGLASSARAEWNERSDGACYNALDRPARDHLTASIVDLIDLIDRSERDWVNRVGFDKFKWARRTAVSARQVDAFLRHMPVGWTPAESDSLSSQELDAFACALNGRDRAQADNLEWILEQEGSAGKVMIFASRYHVSATPVELVNFGIQQVAGTYLRDRLGDRFTIISNAVGSGFYSDGDRGVQELRPPDPDTLDGIARAAGKPSFVLDLRSIPSSVAPWFEAWRLVREGQFSAPTARASDAIVYLDSLTAA